MNLFEQSIGQNMKFSNNFIELTKVYSKKQYLSSLQNQRPRVPMKTGKLKVRRIFKENRNPHKTKKADQPNTKTLLSDAHAPNIVCELNPSPEPMKHYKPVLASRESWMKSLDKATAFRKT